VYWCTNGRRRVSEGDKRDGIWLMDLMYLYETELRKLAIALSWVGRG
jgi:hypothetical protein